MSRVACLLLFAAIAFVAQADYDRKFMVVVHRHGDRSPIWIPEPYEYQWPMGVGQLTGTGVHQLWKIGDDLRNIYHFSRNYTSNLIHVQASDTDRTLQSAQSMMVREKNQTKQSKKAKN